VVKDKVQVQRELVIRDLNAQELSIALKAALPADRNMALTPYSDEAKKDWELSQNDEYDDNESSDEDDTSSGQLTLEKVLKFVADLSPNDKKEVQGA